jgi:hypothetical protein
MNYEMRTNEVSNAIVNRLKSVMTGFDVMPYPNNIDDFTLIHPKGAVLVLLKGGNYTKPKIDRQAGLLNISIYLVIKDVLKRAEHYETLDTVRHTVSRGVKVFKTIDDEVVLDNELRIYHTGWNNQGYDENNVWWYELNFVLEQMFIWGM